MKKRLGIFQMSDKDGIVEDYVTYLLKDVAKNVEELIVIVNGTLQEKETDKLREIAQTILFRENSGYDAMAFKEGILNLIGLEYIRGFEELLIFNDTFYGPLYPFKEVFDAMETRVCDFWGLTFHAERVCEKEEQNVPGHLQSFFIVVRNRMLQSSAFEDFWQSINCQDSGYFRLVHEYEFRLTNFFEKAGFVYDYYVKDEELNTDKRFNYSHFTYSSYSIMKKYRMPVLKRKSLTVGKDLTVTAGEEVFNALKYVEEQTEYDVGMIWKDLLRKTPLCDLKNMLNLNYILPYDVIQKKVKIEKTVVIAHVTYEEILADCIEYLRNLPREIDLYITSYKGSVLERIEAMCKENGICLNGTLLMPNRGRDVGAFFVGCREILKQYEYVCFVHDKKTSGGKGEYSIGASFQYMTWDNMLKSEAYIRNILATFQQNKYLGILSPPIPLHADYKILNGNEWSVNYKRTKEELEKMGVRVPISEHNRPYTLSTCFWARTDALKKALTYSLSFDDFKEEPLPMDGELNHALERCLGYVAQDAGYYTGIVENTEYAALDLQNLRYSFCELNRQPEVEKIFGLWRFVSEHKKIYVYGAGGEGCRVKYMFRELGEEIVSFVVSDAHKSNTFSVGKVIGLSEVPKEGGVGIIVALNKNNTQEVMPLLKDWKPEDIFYMNK